MWADDAANNTRQAPGGGLDPAIQVSTGSIVGTVRATRGEANGAPTREHWQAQSERRLASRADSALTRPTAEPA